MNTQPDAGLVVVAHFQDGRVLKGTTRDFAAAKPTLHLFPGGVESTKPVTILVADLKALFFVRSYTGDAARQDAYDFELARGQGRRVTVTFKDGETISGFTMGLTRGRPGFFLIPADPDGNNARLFVVVEATRRIDFVTDDRPVTPTAAP